MTGGFVILNGEVPYEVRGVKDLCCVEEMLRCAQHDMVRCHPERSEGSLVRSQMLRSTSLKPGKTFEHVLNRLLANS